MQVDSKMVASVKDALGELPPQRFERYHGQLGLSAAQATQIIENAPLAAYFDACVVAGGNAQQTVNFVLGDLSRLANESGTAVHRSPVAPSDLAELIALVEAKTINSKIAKELVVRMWRGEGAPQAIVQREGLAQTSDAGAIDEYIAEVLAANEPSVASYKAGKTNVIGFLVGQVMKASRGKANPAMVQERLRERLS